MNFKAYNNLSKAYTDFFLELSNDATVVGLPSDKGCAVGATVSNYDLKLGDNYVTLLSTV